MKIPYKKVSQGEAEQKENMEGGLAVLHPTHQTIAYTPLPTKPLLAGKDATNNKEDSNELEQQAAKKLAENSRGFSS